MPEFIIHVGPPKTGSRYIQQGLYSFQMEFNRRGIEVPTEWRDSEINPSHTGLLCRLVVAHMIECCARLGIPPPKHTREDEQPRGLLTHWIPCAAPITSASLAVMKDVVLWLYCALTNRSLATQCHWLNIYDGNE